MATFDKTPTGGVGRHNVSVRACNTESCSASTEARVRFTVLPKPTPTPTATPTADPEAHADADPDADPDALPEPDTRADSDTDAGADGRRRPAGFSTQTSPPEPSPSPPAVVVEPSPSPSGNPFVPALASFIDGPGPIDPAVVGTNLLLTLLVVFLFGLTAEIFNSTMDANRAVVHGWWMRLITGPLAFVHGINFTGAGLSRLSGTGRFGSIVRVLTILGLTGLIYGFLSPDFGLDPQEPDPVHLAGHRARLHHVLLGGVGEPPRQATVQRECLDPAVRHGRHRGDPGGHHLALDDLPARPRLRLHRVGRDHRAGRPGQA